MPPVFELCDDDLQRLIEEEIAIEGSKFLRSVNNGIQMVGSKSSVNSINIFNHYELSTISATIEKQLKSLFEKIIFLDIDGVLAIFQNEKPDISYLVKGTAYPFTSSCVSVLNEILRQTNAEIVLTSSWRLIYNREQILQIFEDNRVYKAPIECTSITSDDNRKAEIEEFIISNHIQKYVILDDVDYGFDPINFVQTDNKKGLIDDNLLNSGMLLT